MNEQQKFSFQVVVTPIVYFLPKSHKLHCNTKQLDCNSHKTTFKPTAWKTRKQAMASHNGLIIKDVRAQKFPRTDFFKTLTVGRK